ncbi:hypothetical protein C8J56DRAFT_921373 [Mycena floridula]|nr:hypothetical protein C8J56DRAFT_921373 [Mycena floridula]
MSGRPVMLCILFFPHDHCHVPPTIGEVIANWNCRRRRSQKHSRGHLRLLSESCRQCVRVYFRHCGERQNQQGKMCYHD